MKDVIPLLAALANPNVVAFQHMLRYGEGTYGDDGYRTMFGGEKFDSFADHPRKRITKKLGGKSITSTAAGAYQYLMGTWDEVASAYGLKDFSPKNQDIGCVALFIRRKALDDILAGRFEQAVRKCNREWASLPESPYGQPVVTMARAKQEYEKWGGTYAPVVETDVITDVVAHAAIAAATPPETLPEPIPTTASQEPPVTPFIAAAIPSLISAVPELVKMFGSDSPTSQRNVKAAEVAVNIAKEALGVKNEQELVETLSTDPEAGATVRAAVRERWYELQEVGGGIQAAREAAIRMQGDRTVWYNPAMIISIMLLAMPFMLLVDVLFVHPDNYAKDGLLTQIVTGVLAIIMVVSGFWLGNSVRNATGGGSASNNGI